MIPVTIHSVRLSEVTQHRVVVLCQDVPKRFLSIWIGAYEADAIAIKLQNVAVGRPLSHDLMALLLAETGANVVRVVISRVEDDSFFANIVLDVQGQERAVDCRPSDALALAVRVGVPVFVEESVMDSAGVDLNAPAPV